MNFDQFVEKINKAKEDVKLSGSVKNETRGKLLNFIELRPLAPRIKRVSVSMFPIFKPMPIFASILVLMVMSMGVSFAAEKSLPGELLYAIKVNFNEEIVGALNVTSSGKATWEAKRAERRLEEADKLTMNSEAKPLEEDKIAKLEEKFEEHADKVAARIDKMESEGKVRKAAEVAIKFQASLKAHEEILEKIADKKLAGSAPSIMSLEAAKTPSERPLENKLRENLASIEARRMILETKIATEGDEDDKDELEDAAEARLSFAKFKIEDVRKFLDNNKERLSVESYSEIEAKLEAAKQAVDKGREYADQGLAGEAYNLAGEAVGIAERASLLLKAKLELNLNGDKEPVFVPPPVISPPSNASGTININ